MSLENDSWFTFSSCSIRRCPQSDLSRADALHSGEGRGVEAETQRLAPSLLERTRPRSPVTANGGPRGTGRAPRSLVDMSNELRLEVVELGCMESGAGAQIGRPPSALDD